MSVFETTALILVVLSWLLLIAIFSILHSIVGYNGLTMLFRKIFKRPLKQVSAFVVFLTIPVGIATIFEFIYFLVSIFMPHGFKLSLEFALTHIPMISGDHVLLAYSDWRFLIAVVLVGIMAFFPPVERVVVRIIKEHDWYNRLEAKIDKHYSSK